MPFLTKRSPIQKSFNLLGPHFTVSHTGFESKGEVGIDEFAFFICAPHFGIGIGKIGSAIQFVTIKGQETGSASCFCDIQTILTKIFGESFGHYYSAALVANGFIPSC